MDGQRKIMTRSEAKKPCHHAAIKEKQESEEAAKKENMEARMLSWTQLWGNERAHALCERAKLQDTMAKLKNGSNYTWGCKLSSRKRSYAVNTEIDNQIEWDICEETRKKAGVLVKGEGEEKAGQDEEDEEDDKSEI